MKTKLYHAFIAVGAVLAFVPILAVDSLLDTYVRNREAQILQQRVNEFSAAINANIGEAVTALRRVVAESPSLCTPTFSGLAQTAIENSLSIRQLLVENLDGVQYCDAYGRSVTYSALTDSLTLPGKPESISVVHFADLTTPVLKVSVVIEQMRRVSVFVPMLGLSEASLGSALPADASLRISLTNGSTVLQTGRPQSFGAQSRDSYIVAQGFAGETPVKVELALPFAEVRAGYAELDTIFSVLACLVSAGFLLSALHFVRKTRVPSFDLERAIGRSEIKPYYQPVINLRTGELMGCEVLCRWEKPNGQVVPPGVFIDYAEQTGLAIPMTLSLMQQVRYDLAALSRKMPDMKISINLFEGHFRDVGIVDDVQAIFGNSDIGFHQLVFEITERRPLENSAVVNSVISGLHALGARLALDDTGTGHSNLAYLATLGVDVIKIDRVFVDMIKPGISQVPVLDGLIAMSKDLGCEIIAEGVETEEQALYLRSRGVINAQGYIFAPALKIGAFRDLALALLPPGDDSLESDKTASTLAA